ncbi:MAG: GNAT family N-acetyltransferase [Geminicoccaceae bacterium]
MIAIRPATPADRGWIADLMDDEWGGPTIWADGRLIDTLTLPTLIAGERQGLAIYEVAGDRAELVLLHALEELHGIGTALVSALDALLAPLGVRELHLTTTNDNLAALRFYQRRGFRLAALRSGAIAEARRFKPGIPEYGDFGIPLRDELRLVREIPGA